MERASIVGDVRSDAPSSTSWKANDDPVELRPHHGAAATTPTTHRRGCSRGSSFTLSFALLLSDYMVRQVLAAVFPLLKDEWA